MAETQVKRQKKALVNVLGVVYLHVKTSDGGDLYLTRFGEPLQEHLKIKNWYERDWFNKHKVKLLGTSSVYRVPTKDVHGTSLDLVVKNCRVGEDVPINTHTLQEFCDAEFNSPWEEFATVMEMREGKYGGKGRLYSAQRPLAIYVPPERMQQWQSGRSTSRIARIRARHPGIDLDILKQYKLVYEWIQGGNIVEVFEHVAMPTNDMVHHLKAITAKAMGDMEAKGYLMADMKPEHVIIGADDFAVIEALGRGGDAESAHKQVEMLHRLINSGFYSIIDYELLFRTPDHEDAVKYSRRHSYLDDQRDRYTPTELPSHLSYMEVMGVPYIYGHAESTGGHLWVVGRNARLFDYFLPERWRKTPSLSLSDRNEVYYTVTKDNIHLVWATSRVGEIPDRLDNPEALEKIRANGFNSPFEEFALATELNRIGIHAVYVRAIYMTGSAKMERSSDRSRYESHKALLDAEGAPILQEEHNYITIRGFYNGPDDWVSEHEDALYTPMDLDKAVRKGVITENTASTLQKKTIERLAEAGYDGSLLEKNDLLIALDTRGKIVRDRAGRPDVIICNLELIWKRG